MTDLKKYITPKTNSVYDYQFVKTLETLPIAEWMSKSPPFDCRLEYLEKIDSLIKSATLNTINGLERFKTHHLINGTTQSFDEAYFVYKNKRLRIFRGEYAYHKRIVKNFVFIEDEPIIYGDYVIVSNPFCSTGDTPEGYNDMLTQAMISAIPVIVDCAYFGTCHDVNIDVSHPAIESVSFSLTKGMGMGDIRSGIRYSNFDNQNPIAQQNEYNHTVLLAAKIGLHMMERFDFDYIPTTYMKHQKNACKKANITPTKCMHLGLGDEKWDDYKIDDIYNRLGIRELVKAEYRGNI